MKTKMLRWIAPAVLSLALAACSDDDAPSDPAGTVTLNMLDAENGKTYLGSTGFYINEADNFYGTGPFWIADVGPVRGIGSLGGPSTSGLTDEAAVMPGNGYMIFADDALLVFPSGTTAAVVGSEYCKVYVDSWLAEDKGAVVKYLSDRVSADGSLEIELASSDFEAVCEPGQEAFDLEASGRVLKIRPATMSVSSGDYGIYLRIGDRYTRIRVEVRW